MKTSGVLEGVLGLILMAVTGCSSANLCPYTHPGRALPTGACTAANVGAQQVSCSEGLSYECTSQWCWAELADTCLDGGVESPLCDGSDAGADHPDWACTTELVGQRQCADTTGTGAAFECTAGGCFARVTSAQCGPFTDGGLCVFETAGTKLPAFACSSAIHGAWVCPDGVGAAASYQCMYPGELPVECWLGAPIGPCASASAAALPDAGACAAANQGAFSCEAGQSRGQVCTPLGWQVFFDGPCF